MEQRSWDLQLGLDRVARTDKAGLVGGDDCLRAAAEPELGQHPVDVRLHRREADEQRRGDVCVREAAGDEDKYFALPLGALSPPVCPSGARQ